MNLKNHKGGKKSKLGIAMTEYLIVLGVVALGCVLAFGLFGKEAKVVGAKLVVGLSGKTEAPADVAIQPSLSTMGNFAQGGATGSGGGSNGGSTGTTTVSETEKDALWGEFLKKFGEHAIEGASEVAKETAEEALEVAMKDMKLSKAQYRALMERAASEFAKNGELGSVLAQESVAYGKINLLRDVAELNKAGIKAGLLKAADGLVKVVTIADDCKTVISEGLLSESDPKHKHEHDGKLVGTAVGAVAASALVAATAPVSVPVMILGAIGAAAISVAAPKIMGWLGSLAD